MIAEPVKTPLITPDRMTLTQLLDEVVTALEPRSVLAITSKIVSLCEGSYLPVAGTDKAALIRSEADFYMAEHASKWGIEFTIKDGTLIPNAGIDESNAGDIYVLWPKDAQQTANAIRAYLAQRFGLREIGVIITDSTCRPMRLGVSGIALAFSGFRPLRDYVGQSDLFDRPFKVSQADIVGGLASTAVLMMGEGAERTPLALLREVTVADFVDRDPTAEELGSLRIPLADDLFAPFLQQVAWLPGKNGGKGSYNL